MPAPAMKFVHLLQAHIKSKRPPIISIKQARIDGRSLHCYSTACIKIAPSDDAAAHALRQRCAPSTQL